MFPDVTPQIAAYGQRLWDYSRAYQRSGIGLAACIRNAAHKWRPATRFTKRLSLLMAEADWDEAANPSTGPNRVERLENKIASTNDAQLREQYLRLLSES